MGFHDRMVQIALVRRQTSADFRAAAREHSIRFWQWIIAAGIVDWAFGSVWYTPCLLLAAWSAAMGVSASIVASRLERLDFTKR